MNYDRCATLISHLDSANGCTGSATEEDRKWLTTIGLPKPLLRIMQFHWVREDCTWLHFELMSVASIRQDEFTDSLLHYRYLNVGCVMNGDWLVIDLSTNECSPGFVSHEQWSGDQVDDPRPYFASIASGLECLLIRIDRKEYIPIDYFEAVERNEVEAG